jgi:hypothetical protein
MAIGRHRVIACETGLQEFNSLVGMLAAPDRPM